MSADSPTAREGISIVRAMICFGKALAAVLVAAAIFQEWRLPPAEYRDTLQADLFGFAVFGLFFALQSALFFGALLWFTERHLSKPLGVARWLAVGVMANAPMAALAWALGRTFDRTGGPLDWENISQPLVILACGFLAALAASPFQKVRRAA